MEAKCSVHLFSLGVEHKYKSGEPIAVKYVEPILSRCSPLLILRNLFVNDGIGFYNISVLVVTEQTPYKLYYLRSPQMRSKTYIFIIYSNYH